VEWEWKVHRAPPISGSATVAELRQLAALHGLDEARAWTSETLSYELRRAILEGVEWQLEAIGRGFSKAFPPTMLACFGGSSRVIRVCA
jgi:hypothetical protein